MNWIESLKEEYGKPYFIELRQRIKEDRDAGQIILPFPESLTYRAFELTPLESVKVVILGADPYPDVKNAMGLAFSSQSHLKTPSSLKNIFKELKNDLGIDNKFNDLSYWAAQGVFLLNTVLTVIQGKSGSHKDYGWQEFTDKAIETICKNKKYMIYCLLGNEAQKKEDLIIKHSIYKYDIIKLPHPSGNSAHTGFFWSKPYSKINNLLTANNLTSIDWRL